MGDSSVNEKVKELCTHALKLEVDELQAYLKETGLDVNLTDSNGSTALHLASEKRHSKALRNLITCGADVNLLNSISQTALMIAARSIFADLECFQALIDNGARLDAQDKFGRTALHFLLWRVHRPRAKYVQMLLNAGANSDIMDCNGMTPLMYAANYFVGEDCIVMEMSFESPIYQSECLRIILQSGANPNLRDREGRSALIHLTGYNYIVAHGVGFVEPDPWLPLINHGADINIQNNEGMSALMYASKNCLHHCCKHLLKHKAYVNLKDTKRRTALIHAATKCLKICGTLLVANGADVNAQDEDGRTALMYASYCDTNSSSLDPLIEKADVNIQDNDGRTALMYAILHDSPVLNDLIKRKDVNLDIQDKEGRTAVMFATSDASRSTLKSLGIEKMSSLRVSSTVLGTMLKDLHAVVNIYKDREAMNKIGTILENGVNPLLGPCHCSYIHRENIFLYLDEDEDYPDIFCLLSFIKYNRIQLVRLLVCNGVIETFRKDSWRVIEPIHHATALNRVDVVKYFIATSYLTLSGVAKMRCFAREHVVQSYDSAEKRTCKDLLHQAMSQPWPLVKLAFIAVSTTLGAGPDRERRILQTQLPPRIQRMLMFQEPVSRLPVSQWVNIPLCFDPVEYETLPKPRPLLYYWPFGRVLVSEEEIEEKI